MPTIIDGVFLHIISITLHVLSFVIWIGGMFLAHMALRPVVATVLEPPLRLTLMSQVLSRFFPWVWLAVILLWVTGFALTFGKFGGMANVGIYVHIMLTIAAVMTIIYMYIFFVPFLSLKQNVVDENFPEAGKSLATIRQLIGINLWLGLIVIIIGTAGRYILG